MNGFQLFKQWMRGGCVWFTSISLCMICFGLLFSPAEQPGIEWFRIFLFYPCGLIMSAAGILFKYEKLAKHWRSILHYVMTVLAFFLCLYLPSNAQPSFFPTLLVISLLYWILFFAVHIFHTWLQRPEKNAATKKGTKNERK